jgi:hypothetical protein
MLTTVEPLFSGEINMKTYGVRLGVGGHIQSDLRIVSLSYVVSAKSKN